MVTRWEDLPLFLTAEHLADLLPGRTVGGIKKAAQRGRLPGPAAICKKPWTWNRDEWRRWYEGGRTRRVA
jgi:hypothetical protein